MASRVAGQTCVVPAYHDHDLILGSENGELMKRRLTFILFLGTCSTIATYAQNCQTATSIPSDSKSLGGGSATVQYDGTTKIKGGQSVYVQIKNENVLGVSYTLSIEKDDKPPITSCTYKALIPPRASVILWGSLFDDPPITWNITVSIGDESDAGVLTYQ